MTMTKKQIEILTFCGYKIDGNKIYGEKECIASIIFDDKSKMFALDVKAHTFEPGDYDSIEMLYLAVYHMLGLIYNLNTLGDGAAD